MYFFDYEIASRCALTDALCRSRGLIRFFVLLVTFFIFTALLAAISPAAPITNAPLSKQDDIFVQVIFDYADSHVKTVQGGGTIRYESERNGVFEATLHRYYAFADVDSFKLENAGGGSISVSDSLIMQSGGTVARTETGGSAPGEGTSMTVHIDSVNKKYSFIFEILGKTVVTLTGPFTAPSTDENTAGLSYTSGDLALPSEPDVIRGSATYVPELGSGDLGTNITSEGRVMKSLDGGEPAPVHVRWQIGRPGPRPPLELILSVEDYDNWIPEGPKPSTAAGSPGNKAIVVAKLRRKDGQPLTRGAATVRFTLPQNSAEPGVCLNFPIDAKADPKDLDFRYVSGGDAKPIGQSSQEAITPVGDWKEARATLGCFDWGAYGKISATAEVPGYGEVVATVENSTERNLRVPKRAADSFIADAWKTRHNAADLADTDDNEKSEGNKNDGDGFTLYEEYRGIISHGEHSRKDPETDFDPKTKELVVIVAEQSRVASSMASDEKAKVSLLPADAYEGSIRAGGKLLGGAISRGHVVLIKESEAPASRVINANTAYSKQKPQHGVLVYNMNALNEPSAGSDSGITAPLDRSDKTPEKTDFIAIDFAGIARGFAAQSIVNKVSNEPMPYTLDEEVANTVAHELAHACGVSHHGDKESGSPTHDFDESMVPPKYTIIGADGSEYAKRPFEMAGAIAASDSRSSGDIGCIMCYANYYSWRLTSVKSQGYVWRALLPMPMGTTLCTGREGAKPNATFGPAAAGRGNCRSKVRIKDF